MRKQMVMVALALLLTACIDEDQQGRDGTEASSSTGQEQTRAAAGLTGKAALPVDQPALIEEAVDAVKTLGGSLKEELEAAMKDGGPVEAMDICSVIAPELAQMVSSEKGLKVSRVSLKSRNSVLGTPSVWQAKVLQDFEARKAKGEGPATLVYAEVVDNQFRFMKAIPTSALCLHCHGANLSPEVRASLAELYPQDKATGYKEGDLRGAFVVIKNIDQ